jgi:hypothetical protein
VVAAYETTYASIFAVTTDVTDVAVARRRCVRRSCRCAAAKEDHREQKDGFHETPSVPARAQKATARGLGQAEESKKPAPFEGDRFLAGLELLHPPPTQDHRRTQGQKATSSIRPERERVRMAGTDSGETLAVI